MVGDKPVRYQVFLSSTFTDLQRERLSISRALLFMERCIPAGMERFPASSFPPWDVIRPILDLTDYSVLLIGYRYGSVTEDGLGYTEREYDYAYETGVPVIPFVLAVDPGSLPETMRDTDAATTEKLDRFREKVRSRHTAPSWDSPEDLASRVVASLVHEFDAKPRPGWVRGYQPPALEEAEPPPTPAGSSSPPSTTPRPKVSLQTAVDDVLDLPALSQDLSVNGSPEVIQATHAERLAAIEEGTKPLLAAVGRIIAGPDRALDREWQLLIPALAPNTRMSGSTDLINLYRAPGVLLYHFAGCVSAAAGRDEIIGRLLSRWIVVEDPFHGDVPAAASLVPSVAYPGATSMRRLYDYLSEAVISLQIGRQRSEEAWGRWTYLYFVECQYLQANGVSVYPGYPHLKVEESGRRQMRVVEGKSVLREFEELGDQHPILRAGMCDGNYELFIEAAATFESNYSHWADQRDWAALPGGSGWLPTGPHYPGERPPSPH